MTIKDFIILALGLSVILVWDAWKNVDPKEAVEQINIWINRDMPMTREWVYKFATLYAVPLLMSVVCVMDMRHKAPIKRAMYWTWLGFFSFTFLKLFWDFDRDNYFFLYVLIPGITFGLAAWLKHRSHNGATELRKDEVQEDPVETVKAYYRSLANRDKGVQGSDTTMFNSSTSAKYKKELAS